MYVSPTTQSYQTLSLKGIDTCVKYIIGTRRGGGGRMVTTKKVIYLAVMDIGYHSVHEKPAITYTFNL